METAAHCGQAIAAGVAWGERGKVAGRQYRGGANADAKRRGAAGQRRRGALTTQAREWIERKIVAGEIVAGQKLNAYALARTIGVSRSPVREAMHALVQAGLVQAIPNRGLFVRVLDVREMIDLYDIRIGLARQAGRLLAARINDEQLADLEPCWSVSFILERSI